MYKQTLNNSYFSAELHAITNHMIYNGNYCIAAEFAYYMNTIVWDSSSYPLKCILCYVSFF